MAKPFRWYREPGCLLAVAIVAALLAQYLLQFVGKR